MTDVRRRPGMTVALVALLVLSSTLAATGALVLERTFASVDALFENTRPPHFLQMHAGPYDAAALDRFAAAQPGIEAWAVEELLGFDGAALAWSRPGSDERGDLSGSLLDNLFVTQNPDFDQLVLADGVAPEPADGEVYVPVAYQQRYGLRAGDVLTVRTDAGLRELTVRAVVRDGQMASSLSSGTRLLVSPGEHAALAAAGGGAPEIIVAYRLADGAGTSALQRAYESEPALPHDGQAVTLTMILMINALGDGLVAVALVAAAGLLVAIALINLRLVIRSTLEDEAREIGALRAVGVPTGAVGRLFLGRYALLTALGCVLGGLLALPATAALTRGVRVTYGDAPLTGWSVLAPLAALAVVFVLVLLSCRGVLRSVRRVPVVDALAGAARPAGRRRRPGRLRGTGSVDTALVRVDLRADARQWALLPAVFALAAVLVTVPANVLSTLSSPDFVTYLGTPTADLRADVALGAGAEAEHDAVLAGLRAAPEVVAVRDFGYEQVQANGPEGWAPMRVQVGDHAGLAYLAGRAPGAGEIALSVLNAQAYGVGVGDVLRTRRDGVEVDLRVTGTYQDATGGGFTAKVAGAVEPGAAGYTVLADLAEGADATEVARRLGGPVIPMREYVDQTMAQVTGAFRSAAVISLAFGLGVAALITGMFLTLRRARERGRDQVLTALGFTRARLAGQLRAKTLLTVTAGTALGVLLGATAGEWLVGAGLRATGLGLARLEFLPDPWLAYLILPAALVVTGLTTAVVLTARRAS